MPALRCGWRFRSAMSSTIGGLYAYLKDHPLEENERVLLGFRRIMEQTADENGGLIRVYAGDSCLMTFPEAAPALLAVRNMNSRWMEFAAKHAIPCRLRTVIHKGDFYLYDTFMFGDAIDMTYAAERLSRKIMPGREENVTLVTDSLCSSIDRVSWDSTMKPLQADSPNRLFQFMPDSTLNSWRPA